MFMMGDSRYSFRYCHLKNHEKQLVADNDRGCMKTFGAPHSGQKSINIGAISQILK
tara:strand:+ start:205 stop:372 length:168 start_codon:yes stop_codon:yes gene_type:complete